MTAFGKGVFGEGLEFKTEVTNGKCPYCHETTVFVSLYKYVYRCITCGADTEQKVNGLISFMPILTAGSKLPVMKFTVRPKDNGS